jgi:hypothetical protein
MYLIDGGFPRVESVGFSCLVRLLEEYLNQRNRYQSLSDYINDIVAIDGGNYSQFRRSLEYYVKNILKRQNLKLFIIDIYDKLVLEEKDLHK